MSISRVYWLGIVICFSIFSSRVLAGDDVRRHSSFDWRSIRQIVVQDRGRLKPLETYATESVLMVTGKRSWKGMPAIEILCGWLFSFEDWTDEAFVKVESRPLKKALGWGEDRRYFSPREILGAEPLARLMEGVSAKEGRSERLGEIDRAASRLWGQRGLLIAVGSRQLAMLPSSGREASDWLPLSALSLPSELPYTSEQTAEASALVDKVAEAFRSVDAPRWNEASRKLRLFLRQELGKGPYPSERLIDREIFYQAIRPFSLAYLLYLAVFLLLLFHLVVKDRVSQWLGFLALGIGFAIHTYGFTVRTLISGRAPVTNMYESVIWVSWGIVLLSVLVWLAYRNAAIIVASSIFAIAALILADSVPSVLDPSIQPLEPVLRSNFWLTTHVLTITLSYAAFAMSLCLGNVALGFVLFKKGSSQRVSDLSMYMYRSVQIGVVLLAAGTILGGVWADYSWGRFWGWDPKEVWALVTLLLYLAVLHGRYVGWLKEFGFIAGCVLSFLGVLMAWYGVNFILGVGLHAYGFGSGGALWAALFAAIQIGWVLCARFMFRLQSKSGL